MDKRRFVDINAIGIDPNKDVSKKFVNVGPLEIFFGKKEQKITQADVAAYAREILSVCKRFVDSNQSDLGISFLIHSLSTDKLFADLGFTATSLFYYPRKEDFEENADVALNRLRAGLMEEIKKQLNSSEEFANLNQDDIFMKNFSASDFGVENEVGEITNIPGKQFYFKRLKLKNLDREDLEKLNRSRLEFLTKAQEDKKKGTLPPSILLPQSASPESTELLSVKREMFVLNDLIQVIKSNKGIDHKKVLEDLSVAVQMILDAARGCLYIQEQGFVLMDIDRYNIGYDMQDKHGIMFDWDCMAKIGDEIGDDRLHKAPLYRDDKFKYGKYAHAQEMVFQLGVALKEVANLGKNYLSDKVFGELYALSLMMVKFDGREGQTDVTPLSSKIGQPDLKRVIEVLEENHKEI